LSGIETRFVGRLFPSLVTKSIKPSWQCRGLFLQDFWVHCILCPFRTSQVYHKQFTG